MGSFKDECNQISSQNLGHSFSNTRPSVTEVIILGKKQRERHRCKLASLWDIGFQKGE